MKKGIVILIFSIVCALVLAYGGSGVFLINLLSNFCLIMIVLFVAETIHKQIEIHQGDWLIVFVLCLLILNVYFLFFADSKDRVVLISVELSFVVVSVLITLIKFLLKKSSKGEWLSNLSMMMFLLLLSIAIDRVINLLPALKMVYVDMSHIFLVMGLWLVFRNFIVTPVNSSQIKH